MTEMFTLSDTPWLAAAESIIEAVTVADVAAYVSKRGEIIRVDSPQRGRWAVLVAGSVLCRCRTKTEARTLARMSADEGNPYKCVVRRWRRG